MYFLMFLHDFYRYFFVLRLSLLIFDEFMNIKDAVDDLLLMIHRIPWWNIYVRVPRTTSHKIDYIFINNNNNV